MRAVDCFIVASLDGRQRILVFPDSSLGHCLSHSVSKKTKQNSQSRIFMDDVSFWLTSYILIFQKRFDGACYLFFWRPVYDRSTGRRPKQTSYRYCVAKSARPGQVDRAVGESVKTAEVIRDKAEEQNIMCLLHREWNPATLCSGFLKQMSRW